MTKVSSILSITVSYNSILDPQIMTIATLTGHAVLAMGPYSIVMDNGPARAANTARTLQVLTNQNTA